MAAKRPFRLWWHIGLGLLALFVVLAAVDFSAFIGRVKRLETPALPPSADAVVVLTGAPGRIPVALDLAAEGAGQRVLISGVAEGVSLEAIAARQGGPAEVYACCVDLGARARTTIGNGEETARWARARGYDRLIVVTSDYHMPRSLIELRRSMPEAEFLPWPVRTGLDPDQTFRDPGTFRGLLTEWAKYRVTALFRERAVAERM